MFHFFMQELLVWTKPRITFEVHAWNIEQVEVVYISQFWARNSILAYWCPDNTILIPKKVQNSWTGMLQCSMEWSNPWNGTGMVPGNFISREASATLDFRYKDIDLQTWNCWCLPYKSLVALLRNQLLALRCWHVRWKSFSSKALP